LNKSDKDWCLELIKRFKGRPI